MDKKLVKKMIIGGMSVLLAASGLVPSRTLAAGAAEQMQSMVTLNLNGGKLPDGINLTFNASVDTVLPVPTRKNYSFQGWYADELFTGTAITVLPAGSAQGNITYYAKWEPVVYSIQFETYGGSIEGEIPTQHIPETELQLPDQVTKENCDFAGWYDNPEFTGKPYQSIKPSDTGNKTFYAKWEIRSYTVILNLNGGSLSDGTVLTFDIGTQAVLPIPTKKNCSFGGWYSDKSFQGLPVSVITETDYANKSFYAKWIPNPCNVTLNLNGGNLPQGMETIHTPGAETPLPIPIYEGFTFEGWYLSETFAGEALYSIPADASGNLVYYAKWSYRTNPTTQPSQKDKALKVGTLATVGKSTYKVTNSKKHMVAFIESYNQNITVPNTVQLSGTEYKVTAIAAKACKLNTRAKSIVIGKNVTSIGKYAFDGCSSLKKINVKSTILKTVGKKALRGIHPKCVVNVPKNKSQTYKKLFRKKGQADTVKIKKYL